MPKGGFGNLIALPLQWMPRREGNSEFVDDDLNPYRDQWKLLKSIRRLALDHLDWTVAQASRQGAVIAVRAVDPDPDDLEHQPWLRAPSRRVAPKPVEGPFPTDVEIVLSNMLFVPKAGLPEAMLSRIVRIAAFQNPAFYRAQAMRLNTWDKPRVIGCADDLAAHLALPRNCRDEVVQLLQDHKIKVVVRDERTSGRPISAKFVGELRTDQTTAMDAIVPHDTGILSAPTAFGKTVIAAALIARRGVNTLVLVHRRQLLDQWRERLSIFLGAPLAQIGQIVGGKMATTGTIDVALIQTLRRKGEVDNLVVAYGHVIVDECHHLSAISFEKVMKEVKAKFITGLTATPTRKDGHHPVIFMQCGPIRHRIDARKANLAAPFKHVVFARETGFQAACPAELTIQDLYSAIMKDAARNEMIVRDVAAAIRRRGSPLVLTHRTEHLETLANSLRSVCEVVVLKGGMGKQQRLAASNRLAQIPGDQPRIIVATGSYIGEGFDDPRLDTLFLTMPISWKGTLQQYAGRLHRLYHGKSVVRVYDYVDGQIPVLARMFTRRLRGYQAIGYELGTSIHNSARSRLIDFQ
ncbi:MAG TPA: DEAD/DEAH box helicase family protein [Bryobacteraceae bacterium]